VVGQERETFFAALGARCGLKPKSEHSLWCWEDFPPARSTAKRQSIVRFGCWWRCEAILCGRACFGSGLTSSNGAVWLGARMNLVSRTRLVVGVALLGLVTLAHGWTH
jgi:hypothetical protein